MRNSTRRSFAVHQFPERRSSPSCLLIPRLGGERERERDIPVSLLTALSYSSTRSSLSSLVSARSEARGARLYVDIASLLTGAKDVYDICLTLIGKCFEHSLSLCFFLLRSGGAVNWVNRKWCKFLHVHAMLIRRNEPLSRPVSVFVPLRSLVFPRANVGRNRVTSLPRLRVSSSGR